MTQVGDGFADAVIGAVERLQQINFLFEGGDFRWEDHLALIGDVCVPMIVGDIAELIGAADDFSIRAEDGIEKRNHRRGITVMSFKMFKTAPCMDPTDYAYDAATAHRCVVAAVSIT
jgi:hypothetical protein